MLSPSTPSEPLPEPKLAQESSPASEQEPETVRTSSPSTESAVLSSEIAKSPVVPDSDIVSVPVRGLAESPPNSSKREAATSSMVALADPLVFPTKTSAPVGTIFKPASLTTDRSVEEVPTVEIQIVPLYEETSEEQESSEQLAKEKERRVFIRKNNRRELKKH